MQEEYCSFVAYSAASLENCNLQLETLISN